MKETVIRQNEIRKISSTNITRKKIWEKKTHNLYGWGNN
jgi:hypothetical protein